jgi:hypothetical protein
MTHSFDYTLAVTVSLRHATSGKACLFLTHYDIGGASGHSQLEKPYLIQSETFASTGKL